MDFVYAAFGGTVLYAPTGAVEMTMGDVWHADDPFVAVRPDLFSATPPVVRSTVEKPAPETTPVGETKRKPRAARG